MDQNVCVWRRGGGHGLLANKPSTSEIRYAEHWAKVILFHSYWVLSALYYWLPGIRAWFASIVPQQDSRDHQIRHLTSWKASPLIQKLHFLDCEMRGASGNPESSNRGSWVRKPRTLQHRKCTWFPFRTILSDDPSFQQGLSGWTVAPILDPMWQHVETWNLWDSMFLYSVSSEIWGGLLSTKFPPGRKDREEFLNFKLPVNR